MITEAKFKYAIKDMLKTMPLEEINVTALCERIGCHRQTFYYHYEDIYDLIAAVLLNEDLSDMEKAGDVRGVLLGFLNYIKKNFSFFRATYNSAARDLTDDFIFGKLNAKFLSLFSTKDQSLGLKKEGTRNVARRLANIVADEFGFCFKDPKLTPEKFGNKMIKFFDRLLPIVLPSLVELSRKEEGK